MNGEDVVRALSQKELDNLEKNYLAGNLKMHSYSGDCALGCALSGPHKESFMRAEVVRHRFGTYTFEGGRLDCAYQGSRWQHLEKWYMTCVDGRFPMPEELYALVVAEKSSREKYGKERLWTKK